MSPNQTTQSESITSQNVEEANKESYLWVNEKLEGTPFHINGNEEKGYFLRMGDYRITEFMPTPEEATELLYTDQWNVILTIIAGILHNRGDKNVQIIP